MKLYKVGEKSKAVCESCKQLRSTTFQERDVPLSSGKGMVPSVLVAVCNHCDQIVSIPQQSVPRIQETLRSSRHPLEARIPRHLLDALVLMCYELGGGASESKQTVLFRFYLRRVSKAKKLYGCLEALSQSEEAQGKADYRFSIKLNDELYKIFLKLEKDTLLNKAELVKGIIIQMKKDILDDKNKELRNDLKGVLLLAA